MATKKSAKSARKKSGARGSSARGGAAAAEPTAETKRRARRILALLRKAYPGAGPELQYRSPLELLVATILSAQCTDERVNRVTPTLFARYKTAADYARADRSELEELIRPTGFFRNKAKAIQAAAQTMVERFDGRVPETMDELLELPGVARKTANVVLGAAFGKAEGIVVDTHVFRLAHRLGLSEGKSPEQVERDLMAIFPRKDWIDVGFVLILHGRRVCVARRPRCDECVVAALCPKIGVAPAPKRAAARTKGRPLKERIEAARSRRPSPPRRPASS